MSKRRSSVQAATEKDVLGPVSCGQSLTTFDGRLPLHMQRPWITVDGYNVRPQLVPLSGLTCYDIYAERGCHPDNRGAAIKFVSTDQAHCLPHPES